MKLGPHDLGGEIGFGPVRPEPDEPVFHADWERRVFGITLAVAHWRRWPLDAARHQRELIAPAEYLEMTYYERWFAGLTALLNKTGFIDERPSEPPLRADAVSPQRIRAAPPKADGKPGRFKVGDAVRTRTFADDGHHHRLPDYAQAKAGVIAALRGPHLLPDDSAAGLPRNVQALYSVRFSARALWGGQA
ncbi:MAG TPA: nitrile hydratase subunit beta, partial [Caulobacteraceae bacterium]|nr:nitrile hydratase subunit beta [Caulobacteraceae bacterium]